MKKSGVTIEDLPVNRLHDWVHGSLADVHEAAKPYIAQPTLCLVMFVSIATGPPSTMQISWEPAEGYLNSHLSGEAPGPGQEHGHQWWDTTSGEGHAQTTIPPVSTLCLLKPYER